MKRRRKRKCQHCGEGFLPSPQNTHKQCYCVKAECKKASARRANDRWRAKNPDYHRGEAAVSRVQLWRESNPGYWRPKSASLEPSALQDDCISQVVDEEKEASILERFALQDDCFSQAVVLLGLIAHLTGFTLQDDIARTSRELHKQGRRILGTQPGVCAANNQTESYAKISNRTRAPTARAGPV